MEILAVLLLAASAAILFATEAVRVDIVAVIVLVALALSGLVTPEQALSGFSNPATATVAAMFVLSAALRHTGLIEGLADLLGRTFGSHWLLVHVALLLIAGSVSAFLNNTAVVAIFIPVVVGLSRSQAARPGQTLMPLSFAAQVGGVCTLIGTSTNILVSDIGRRAGQAPFGMFEFAPLGLCFGAVAFAYLAVVAPLLLRRAGPAAPASLRERYDVHDWLAELVVEDDSPLVGATLETLTRDRRFDVSVLELLRGPDVRFLPERDEVLRAGDVLLALGPIRELLRTRAIPGLALRREMGGSTAIDAPRDLAVVEAMVAPASALVGRTLEEVRFRQAHRCQALAIRHHQQIERGKVGRVRLSVGDVLLLQGRRADLDELRAGNDVILLEEVPLRGIAWTRALPALAIVAAVVAGAAAGLAPILVTAIAGCVALVLARIVTIEQAYDAIDWKVIFLLAGVIPLGTALEATGAAAMLGQGIVRLAGDLGPVALVSAFYLATALLTELMSNNASAALLAPLAIATAGSLGVDARPFLVAVMFAASTSFMTPVGYQTNAMVLGPGGYRFTDFLRVGLPLNLLFWLLASALIPHFFPL